MSRTRRHDPEDDPDDEGPLCRRCDEPLRGNEGFTVGICSDCEDEMEADDYDPEDDDFDFDLYDFSGDEED